MESWNDLLVDISPNKAPRNGPIIIPIGPSKIKQSINPIIVPICPDLVPPSFFDNFHSDIATVKVIKMKFKLNSTVEVEYKSKIPSQELTGPGIIGKKLPRIPIRHNIRPKTKSIKSNILYSWGWVCLSYTIIMLTNPSVNWISNIVPVEVSFPSTVVIVWWAAIIHVSPLFTPT